MPSARRFLIAPSLARLLRRERGIGERIVEGHFPGQFGRTHFVSFEPPRAYLVLTDPAAPGGVAEQRTEVPPQHAESLLDVCVGKIGFVKTHLQLGPGCEVILSHFLHPGTLDVLTVMFEDGQHPEALAIPDWFGPEVTNDVAWARHSIALKGPPEPVDVPLSDMALDALLTTLDQDQESAQDEAASGDRDRAT